MLRCAILILNVITLLLYYFSVSILGSNEMEGKQRTTLHYAIFKDKIILNAEAGRCDGSSK